MTFDVIEGGGQPTTLLLSEFIEYAQKFYAEYGEVEVCVDDGGPNLWRIVEIGGSTHLPTGDIRLRLGLLQTENDYVKLVKK